MKTDMRFAANGQSQTRTTKTSEIMEPKRRQRKLFALISSPNTSYLGQTFTY